MNIEQMLFSLHSEELQPGEPADGPCPSLPRLREGLLNPRRWTETERLHILEEDCSSCERTAAAMRQEIWHPGLMELFRHVFSRSPAEQRFTRLHLERDECAHCCTVAGWMSRARALQQLAAADLAKVQGFLDLVASSLVPVRMPALAAVQSWDTGDEPAFYRQADLGDGQTVVSLAEGERPNLELTVSSRNPQLHGRPLRLAWHSAQGEPVLEVALTLEPDAEGWHTATLNLGPAPELREQPDLFPLLYPDDEA